MLKIGENWGKIANYPPHCSTKIGTTVLANQRKGILHGGRRPIERFVVLCFGHPV